MYSLTETFQQCKVIPGKAGWWCGMERGHDDLSFILSRMKHERSILEFGG